MLEDNGCGGGWARLTRKSRYSYIIRKMSYSKNTELNIIMKNIIDVKNKNAIGSYVLTWFMLMCSGTVIFNIKYNSLFIPLFVMYSVSYAVLKEKGKLKIQINEVVLFLAIVCFILGSTVIHFNDGVAINGVVQKMLYLLGTWFACKSMSYKEYKYCYENLTALLCVVAIIIQMLCILGGLPYHWTDINGRLFPLAVGHCVSWRNGNFYRLCGLYIEPGMFQIVINIALMYLIDDISKGDDKKEKRRKVLFFVVYIISVLMTMSTSGYIILIILMSNGIIRYWNLISNKQIKKVLFVLIPIVLTAIIYGVLHSSVIVNKFEKSNYSLLIRKNDIFAGISLIFNRPILGYGYGTRKLSLAFSAAGIANISSGLIGESISFGIVVTIILLILVITNVKGNSRYILNASVIVYLISNMSEACLFFPIMLAFCFSFKLDWNNKVLINKFEKV